MKTIAGVALAAVMACGWAGGARAYTTTIDFTLGGDQFYYYYSIYGAPYGISNADFPAYGSATISGDRLNYTLDDFSLDVGSKHFDKSYFGYVTAGFSSPTLFQGFFISKSKDDNSNGISLNFGYFADLPGYFQIADRVDGQLKFVECGGYGCVTPTVVSGELPSVLPLPSSAPLFGASLLALAAGGYTARRKRKANHAA